MINDLLQKEREEFKKEFGFYEEDPLFDWLLSHDQRILSAVREKVKKVEHKDPDCTDPRWQCEYNRALSDLLQLLEGDK